MMLIKSVITIKSSIIAILFFNFCSEIQTFGVNLHHLLDRYRNKSAAIRGIWLEEDFDSPTWPDSWNYSLTNSRPNVLTKEIINGSGKSIRLENTEKNETLRSAISTQIEPFSPTHPFVFQVNLRKTCDAFISFDFFSCPNEQNLTWDSTPDFSFTGHFCGVNETLKTALSLVMGKDEFPMDILKVLTSHGAHNGDFHFYTLTIVPDHHTLNLALGGEVVYFGANEKLGNFVDLPLICQMGIRMEVLPSHDGIIGFMEIDNLLLTVNPVYAMKKREKIHSGSNGKFCSYSFIVINLGFLVLSSVGYLSLL